MLLKLDSKHVFYFIHYFADFSDDSSLDCGISSLELNRLKLLEPSSFCKCRPMNPFLVVTSGSVSAALEMSADDDVLSRLDLALKLEGRRVSLDATEA